MSDTPFKRTHCPNCHSENDLVLRNKMWECGVEFTDPSWRTKECYRREIAAVTKERDALKAELATLGSACDKIRQNARVDLREALARIKRLEEAGDELETDIKALRQIFNDMGAVVTIGNASMNGWTQAKEAR